MELETDKAVVEVPSSVSGVVREVKVKEGQKVKVGQVIFTLEGGAIRCRRSASPDTSRSSTFPDSRRARLAFQLAMQAEGKTEEQALPPDQPQPSAASRSACRCSWARLQAPNIAIRYPPRRTCAG